MPMTNTVIFSSFNLLASTDVSSGRMDWPSVNRMMTFDASVFRLYFSLNSFSLACFNAFPVSVPPFSWWIFEIVFFSSVEFKWLSRWSTVLTSSENIMTPILVLFGLTSKRFNTLIVNFRMSWKWGGQMLLELSITNRMSDGFFSQSTQNCKTVHVNNFDVEKIEGIDKHRC